MLKITDWHNRYEVGSRGGKPKDGEPLRVGPLEFIRLNAHGRSQGPGYRRLLEIAGKRAMQVFGIFCKFLEIAGSECRDKRGTLYNESGNPATAEELAFILSVPIDQIEHAVKVLCDEKVCWLINTTQLNSTQLNTREGSRNPRKNRESPETRKYTHGDFVKLTLVEHTKLKEKFGEQGTADWIADLDGHIGSKGAIYKSHYRTILNWNRRRERKTTTNSQRQGTSSAGGQQNRPARRDTSESSAIGKTVEA